MFDRLQTSEQWERPTPLQLLIVEDSSQDIELVTLTLEAAKIPICFDVAETERSYAHLLHTQVYDAVLSDYHLPGFSGWRAFEMLRQAGVGYSLYFDYRALR